MMPELTVRYTASGLGAEERELWSKHVQQLVDADMRRREVEAMKILAYLGTVPMLLYYDASGNLLPARY